MAIVSSASRTEEILHSHTLLLLSYVCQKAFFLVFFLTNVEVFLIFLVS